MVKPNLNSSSYPGIFRIGKWLIHPNLNRITYDNRQVKLEPRIMEVLLCLVEHRGETVTRDYLMETLWSDTVVTEDSLNRSISKLRQVFNDDSKQPSVIETISKIGYRLIAPVEEVESAEVISESAASLRRSDRRSELRKINKPTRRVAIWGTMIILALSGFYGLKRTVIGSYTNNSMIRVVPFTSSPGLEFDPSFSPDCNQIAYVWKDQLREQWDIYVKQIGTETPLKLTNSPGVKINPRFSPDGRNLVFTKILNHGGGLFIVPTTGGQERKLISAVSNTILGLDWSPDGKWLAYTDKSAPGEPYAVFLLSIETLNKRKLTSPLKQSIGDEEVAFSPDGKKLAVARARTLGVMDVYLISVKSGEPKRLTFDNLKIHGLDWTPDGRHIIYSSNRGGDFGLWKVAASGGRPELLASGITGADNPAVSSNGDRLAFEKWNDQTNIYKLNLKDFTNGIAIPEQIISSTRWDWNAQISPGGRRLVFVSDRSGSTEIWTSDLEGANLLCLTSFNGPYSTMPRWSPDGRRIIFDSRAEGNANIYVVDAEGGMPRLLTTQLSEDIAPIYSRDGRWVYFASNRSGAWQIWKTNAEGIEATQVTKNGGFTTFESVDGSQLFVTKKEEAGIWQLSIENQEGELIIEDLEPVDWANWLVVEDGIYYVKRDSNHDPSIVFFDFETRTVVQTVELPDLLYKSGLSLSPNGAEMVFTHVDRKECDIMLIENF